MEYKENKQNTKIDELLSKIKEEKINLHSKNYFRFKTLLLIFLIIAIFIISIFFISFIIFNLRISGQASLIGFGGHGTNIFIKFFPWKLFIIDILLIIWASIIIRSFRFGYKTPGIYLLLGIIFIMILFSFVVDKSTKIHYMLLNDADNNKLPILGKMYRCAKHCMPKREEGVFRGRIININKNILLVDIESEKIEDNQIYQVFVPTSQPLKFLKINENIFIAGRIINGYIEATAIRPAPNFPDFID